MGAFSLSAENLSQTQGSKKKGRVLLKDIHFEWKGPSLQVIMGNSGTGKSTLLKTLGAVWRPQRGQVYFDGEPLWAEREENKNILARLGFAFQNNALFNSLSCQENLCLPHRQRFENVSEDERQKLATESLAKFGLEKAGPLYPHELSGGMQKRLALARTLILKPDFIFLDDPTAGLDPITSRHISEHLMTLLRGSSSLVVIVTNDPARAEEWGPSIHFLYEGSFYSPQHEKYTQIKELYL